MYIYIYIYIHMYICIYTYTHTVNVHIYKDIYYIYTYVYIASCKKQGDREIHVCSIYTTEVQAITSLVSLWWLQTKFRVVPTADGLNVWHRFSETGFVEANISPNGSPQKKMRAQCVEHIIHISELKILPLNQSSETGIS